MPIIDTSLVFSSAQAITASAASTGTVKLGAADPFTGRSGSGQPLPITFDITEDFADSGSDGTLTISVQSDALGGNFASPVIHYVSDAIPVASLTAAGNLNGLFRAFLPVDAKPDVRLYYTVANGPFTAGKISASVSTGNGRNVPLT